ncbi:replicative DNA helicase [Synechococcus moorigangaii CMS01]|nr:replicative DNA helicase [Synechococcus moorigangaii CMS01]
MADSIPAFPHNALPPQNIDAEEFILGGILMDPEAMGRVVDLLNINAFYVQAHQEIYKGLLILHTQGKPTDLLALSTWLQDHNLLEKIGGMSKLSQLVDRTVSAVNIDHYAELVMEKFLRRQLITGGHEIVDLAYDTVKPLPEVLDESEQKIFRLTQTRAQNGLTAIAETITEAFSNIEERQARQQEKNVLSGLSSGFYDLDAMTNGFQRSDLVIIAGRPAMGKTSFSLNVATNIAKAHRLPVAIFSLEMSKEQLVQRLLAGEAQIESNRLRAGRLEEMDMFALIRAVEAISDVPLFIDDTANLTVNQMRSQARKLQAEQGGKLGLILIDYLQLMEGGGDNRVQELSKITRSLKGLARELDVPIFALSQLSRGVEARNSKRPMMSDLRESGSIEQDADLVLMLYRDSYYNPDSPERDIAEVIIAKHRNGPTGTVKLIFQPELTKFLNLANSPVPYAEAY